MKNFLLILMIFQIIKLGSSEDKYINFKYKYYIKILINKFNIYLYL